MTPRRCPSPGCNGIRFAEVRPLYVFDAKSGKRTQDGSHVLCVSCYSHIEASVDGLSLMPRPQPAQPPNGPPASRIPRGQALPRPADLGDEP